MHFAKAAIILTLLALIASPTLAHSPKQKPTKSRRSQSRNHNPALEQPIAHPLPQSPVSLVSGSPEYLSGEANVTVKGNENPIIRLGLATSGLTLVEFPASDRFFALHPGNSEMVTIDESPTKQNDHFFVFRAGSGFVPPPPSPSSTGPAASILAQMRSGMVITFLIYPVRELSQMAHRVVVLYDRVEVVAARRAAGLALNLEEKQLERQERSIRIAAESDRSRTTAESRGTDANPDVRSRTVESGRSTDDPDDKSSSSHGVLKQYCPTGL